MSRFTLERDPAGAWVVSAPEIPGCYTYGASIAKATRRMREALVLWGANPRHVPELSFELPEPIRDVVARADAARERARAAAERARTDLVQAAIALEAAGYSRRDAAVLLRISHQRVQQLLDGSPTATPG